MVSREAAVSADLSFTTFTQSNKTLYMKEIMKKRSSKNNAQQYNKLKDYFSYLLLGLILFITVTTYPSDNNSERKVTLQHVWYSGWITAVATGAGVLPFFFLERPNKYWMGISNGKCCCQMFRWQ